MSFDLSTAIPVREREDGLLEKDTFDLSTAMPVDETTISAPIKPLGYSPELTDQQKAQAVVELSYRQKGEKVPFGLKADWALQSPEAAAATQLILVPEYSILQGVRGALDNTGEYDLVDRVLRGTIEPDKTKRLYENIPGAEKLPSWAKTTSSILEDLVGLSAIGMAKSGIARTLKINDFAREMNKGAEEFADANMNKFIGAGDSVKIRADLKTEYVNRFIKTAETLEVTPTGDVKTLAQQYYDNKSSIGMILKEVKLMGERGSAIIPKIGQSVQFKNPQGELLSGIIKEITGQRAIINLGGKEVVATLSQLSLPVAPTMPQIKAETPQGGTIAPETTTAQPTGEGKVVYHGTNRNFDKFDNKFIGTQSDATDRKVGHFFVTNPDIAKEYAEYSAGPGKGIVKAATLNLKNPMIVDLKEKALANEKYYDEVVEPLAEKLQKVEKEFDDSTDSDEQDMLDIKIQRLSKQLVDVQAKNPFDLTREIKKYGKIAKQSGNDGLIIKNVQASPESTDIYSDVHIAFDASQIKLSTPTGQKPPVEPPKTAVSEPPLPPTPPTVEQAQPEIPKGDPVQKIISALKGAKDIRGQQETLYHKARQQKLAKMISVGQKVKGEKGFFSEKGALKGELPKVEFESIRKNLTQEDIDSLFDMVKNSPHLSPWDKLSAREGLANLLGETGGKVPTESEIAKLHKVFGKEFTDTLLEKRPLIEKMKEAGLQIANFPRSIMASFDLSFGLRQGSFAAPRFRKAFFDSFKKQFSWFGSEKAFQENQKVIASNPNYSLAVESGVQFTEMDSLMGEREERFASQWAEIVPGVRQSARAYTGFANKYRMDIFDTLVQDAQKLGLNPQKDRDLSMKIAKFVNSATGRGSLGDFERSAVLLNAFFFSPRLMASRIGILTKLLDPRFYYKESPFIRKEFLKTALSWLGTGLTIMGIAKLMGAEVGDDPISSDFGKEKIGITRIDHWGGFQPYIRMLAQVISGKYKSSTTGKIMTLGEGYRPLTRLEILQRQVESKEAPVFSFITELLKGQTFEGKKINIPKEVALRFVPMLVQDLYDVIKDNPEATPAVLLASFGVGVQTYKPKKGKKF